MKEKKNRKKKRKNGKIKNTNSGRRRRRAERHGHGGPPRQQKKKRKEKEDYIEVRDAPTSALCSCVSRAKRTSRLADVAPVSMGPLGNLSLSLSLFPFPLEQSFFFLGFCACRGLCSCRDPSSCSLLLGALYVDRASVPSVLDSGLPDD
nr:hypothetical protein [Pandoravirus belohorizontensis]